MKMVKSLLLGSAAGLVAVTAGQAADLPVKAKPVQYVKICSLYGAGFYYMPGTDMCIKIGGWVRAEATWGSNGNLAWGPMNSNVNNRTTNNLTDRARGYITADAREQTAYGVARAYIDVGISGNDTSNSTFAFSSNRAFLQWAGFTAGLATSFYDFYPAAALNYRAGYLPTEDTGDGGWYVWAYTAQFGGGVSGTVSLESRHQNQIIGPVTSIGTVGFSGFTAGSGYGGWQMPDIVANLRVDQTWGSAQLMGAAHMLNPTYYGGNTSVASGHPGDVWGFVGGAGIKINMPSVAPGDYFDAEVNYTQGALKYINSGENVNFGKVDNISEAWGVESDCVFGASPGSCNATTGWSAVAGYEHYWTPQWHESFTGGYMHVSYGSTANALLCGYEGSPVAGCSNDWSYWAAGTRLQWNVTPSFYIGVEALYSQLDSATTGLASGLPSNTGVANGTNAVVREGNSGNWAFTVRMHKDFLP